MKEIIYVTSTELHRCLDNIEKIRHRSVLVDNLVQAYNLDKHENFHSVQPISATDKELLTAHDQDYLEFLKFISNIHSDDQLSYREQMDFYKIGYECPPFEELPFFCSFFL